MKIIVHDLSKDDWQGLELRLREGDIVVSQDNNCDISDYIDNCGQLVFISRCVYGSFSPFIGSSTLPTTQKLLKALF